MNLHTRRFVTYAPTTSSTYLLLLFLLFLIFLLFLLFLFLAVTQECVLRHAHALLKLTQPRYVSVFEASTLSTHAALMFDRPTVQPEPTCFRCYTTHGSCFKGAICSPRDVHHQFLLNRQSALTWLLLKRPAWGSSSPSSLPSSARRTSGTAVAPRANCTNGHAHRQTNMTI